jgi:histidinol-phosphate aminotransferase
LSETKRYERANIRRMRGYVPGEQPTSSGVVKLNTNENPYPPSDAVLDALHGIEAETLRRYPPPTASGFCSLASRVHNLRPENVIAVNGGDELLRLAITTFVDPGEPIGVARPCYGLYEVLPAIQDCPVVSVQLEEDWSLPFDFAGAMNAAKAKLVIIANPHAPSGHLTTVERLAEIAEELDGVLLIDEAYVNFIDEGLNHDAVKLVREFSNVLILRTLSKGYSLAGLRFGYGMGAESLIEPMMTKAKDSYNVDAVAQKLAIAALESRGDASRTWEAVRGERRRLATALEGLGFSSSPSQSNFILVKPPVNVRGGASGIYEALKEQRILVRYFDQDRLRDKLRITVGRPEENDVLLSALKELAGS